MYLTKIEILNTGPISDFRLEAKFNSDETPQPILIVGKNGAGKSIVLSYVVNALAAAQTVFFEDADVESGRVYKLRSPTYIRDSANYSVGSIEFTGGIEVAELQLSTRKRDFVGDPPEYKNWPNVSEMESSHFWTNISRQSVNVHSALLSGVYLYFPPNRFEEPAWLNEAALRGKVDYYRKKNSSTTSDRTLVQYSPLKSIQDWLLDLVYDSFAVERRTSQFSLQRGEEMRTINILVDRSGPATSLLNAVETVVLTLLGAIGGKIQWNVGIRNHRNLGLSITSSDGASRHIQNIFALSTGESGLLDMFLVILRDFDFSGQQFESFLSVRGIVVVDEIDLHLHADFQYTVLPSLLKLFPGVQFIISTHSPLLLLGLSSLVSTQGFQLIELPLGVEIGVESIGEFEFAFRAMQETKAFESEVKRLSADRDKAILFVEGDTDALFIRRAAQLLGQESILEAFELFGVEGVPYLDKLWNAHSAKLNSRIRLPWVLLYDCDTNKQVGHVGKLFKRILPRMPGPILTGIENLFDDDLARRARDYKPQFFDIVEPHTRWLKGVQIEVPETWSVNADEKMNFCKWVCTNATAQDFQNFVVIFSMLEDILGEAVH